MEKSCQITLICCPKPDNFLNFFKYRSKYFKFLKQLPQLSKFSIFHLSNVLNSRDQKNGHTVMIVKVDVMLEDISAILGRYDVVND